MGRKIELVGAGPGDPELLTLAAYRAITTADVVIADRLIPTAITALIRGQLLVAPKQPGHAQEAQDQLNAWGLSYLKQGLHVVRLKNGDPFVFGRGGEEILFYQSHGYQVHLIPGISCILAAPSSIQIPLTMRHIADQFIVCTGHGAQDGQHEIPEFVPHRTVVVVMGMGRLAELIQGFQKNGYPADLPVAIIQQATWESQQHVLGTLNTIVSLVQARKLCAPATMVLGHVVTACPSLSKNCLP